MKVYYIDMAAQKTGYISEADLTDEEYAALATPKGRKKPLKYKRKVVSPNNWHYTYESCAHAILLRLRDARDNAHRQAMNAEAKYNSWQNKFIIAKAQFQQNGIINNI